MTRGIAFFLWGRDPKKEVMMSDYPESREVRSGGNTQGPPGSGGANGTPEPDGGVTERRRSRSGVTPPSGCEAEPSVPPTDADSLLELPLELPRSFGMGRRRGKRLVKPESVATPNLSAEQKLLLLDTWRRSGLPAGDFAGLVGMSKHTLYAWKKKFDTQGPAGLMPAGRGSRKGSRLPDLTQRAILMMKEANPEWGCERISDMLLRGPALPASAGAVARVLHAAGYDTQEIVVP